MDLKNFAFRVPSTVLFGCDTVNEVGRQAVNLGGRKVLLVTDRGVRDAGLLDRVRGPLEAERLQVAVFDRALPEPPLTNVQEALAVAEEDHFDVLVGCGGGSAMDLTKAISALLENGGDLRSYFGIDKVPRPGRPMILIPTTSGTGSEVTRMSVLTDAEANLKKVIVSPNIQGRVAIVDPLLTVSAPPRLTASSGIDALIHAIEGYLAVSSNPFSDVLALEAIRLIAVNLVTAVADGQNLEARYSMSLGSLLAGAIINSAGTGAVHALAYPIGGEYHVPHGIANYLTLPQVMERLVPAAPGKFVRIAAAMGESIEGLSPEEAGIRAVRVMRRLGEATGLPTRLRDVGVAKERIPAMAEAAYTEKRLLGNTPRELSVADIAAIYEAAF